jgi:hypothetical protein
MAKASANKPTARGVICLDLAACSLPDQELLVREFIEGNDIFARKRMPGQHGEQDSFAPERKRLGTWDVARRRRRRYRDGHLGHQR